MVAPSIYDALHEFNTAGGNFGHGFKTSNRYISVPAFRGRNRRLNILKRCRKLAD